MFCGVVINFYTTFLWLVLTNLFNTLKTFPLDNFSCLLRRSDGKIFQLLLRPFKVQWTREGILTRPLFGISSLLFIIDNLWLVLKVTSWKNKNNRKENNKTLFNVWKKKFWDFYSIDRIRHSNIKALVFHTLFRLENYYPLHTQHKISSE